MKEEAAAWKVKCSGLDEKTVVIEKRSLRSPSSALAGLTDRFHTKRRRIYTNPPETNFRSPEIEATPDVVRQS